MPRLITGLDAARIAANLDRIRTAIADAGRDPAAAQILAAVKHVPLEEVGTLQEAGLTLLGENRAQELEAKAAQYPDFRWRLSGPGIATPISNAWMRLSAKQTCWVSCSSY